MLRHQTEQFDLLFCCHDCRPMVLTEYLTKLTLIRIKYYWAIFSFCLLIPWVVMEFLRQSNPIWLWIVCIYAGCAVFMFIINWDEFGREYSEVQSRVTNARV